MLLRRRMARLLFSSVARKSYQAQSLRSGKIYPVDLPSAPTRLLSSAAAAAALRTNLLRNLRALDAR